MPQLWSDPGLIAQKCSNLNGTGILFLLLLLYYNIIANENKLIGPNQRVASILVKSYLADYQISLVKPFNFGQSESPRN
jgi:hypothetical protein